MKFWKGYMLSACAIGLISGCTSNASGAAMETTLEALSEDVKADSVISAEELEDIKNMGMGMYNGLEMGKVVSIDKESGDIGLDVAADGSEVDVVIHTDKQTAFWDVTNAVSKKVEDIGVGDEIQAVTDLAYTSSLPPQTSAYVVCMNVGDNFIPNYLEIKAVKKDGDKIMLVGTDSLEWILPEDMEVSLYSSGEKTSLDRLKEGTRCLIWPKILPVSEGQSVSNMLEVEKIVIIDN